MERRLKCGVCAAAALALVLCFGMEQKTRAMQTAGNAQTTLVIDAGHGGFDGGAVGADGTAEQDINLSIAKRVQVLANFFGVPTAMTRPDENALDYNPSRTSVNVQQAAFATGVPPYIYAFHRYTRNSACLSITQDQQF